MNAPADDPGAVGAAGEASDSSDPPASDANEPAVGIETAPSPIAPRPTTWTLRHERSEPLARMRPAAVFDPVRDAVVVFGGHSSKALLADTWLWDGERWTEATPAGVRPSPRQGASLVWDAAREVAVLFGGRGDDPAVWEWSGSWTRREARPGPSPRSYHAMCWDPVRRVTVVFGGCRSKKDPASYLDETWTWDGQRWSRIDADVEAGGAGGKRPPRLIAAQLVWDADRAEAVLFGGAAPGVGVSDQTWTWNGRWERRRPSARPPARAGHTMAAVPARGTVVLLSGTAAKRPGQKRAEKLEDAWEWDGETWVELAAEVRPPARRDAVLVHDSNRDELVLFSGTGARENMLRDTWTWAMPPR